MSAQTTRERITIKDIQKILGFKQSKAERTYRSMRQEKIRQLPIEQRPMAKLPLFVDDLVNQFPGLTREVVKANMAE